MSRKTILFFIVVSVTIFSLALIYMAYAGAPTGSQGSSGSLDLDYEPGELLVRFAPKPDGTQRKLAECNAILTAIEGGAIEQSYKLVPGLTLVKLPENVSHTDNFIFTAIELYRAGIVFDINDINAFVYTFVHKVWDGNSTDPKYHDFIDGHNAPVGAKYLEWKQGSNIAPGWVGLGAFDSDLHEVFEAGDTSSVTNKLWLNTLAYYGELARNLVAGNCPKKQIFLG
ncbi:MAG: hypothetical protein FVQ85_08720 [Planctomycetes bacterium]|nr:hypothetical protein [Planctomycetota bacterium]